jgi:hypothetical protein
MSVDSWKLGAATRINFKPDQHCSFAPDPDDFRGVSCRQAYPCVDQIHVGISIIIFGLNILC